MRRGVRFAALAAVALVVQACNSTDTTLDPNAAQASPPEATTPPVTAPTVATPGTATLTPAPATPPPTVTAPTMTPGTPDGQAAALDTMTRVVLAPVVGTTVEAARPLSQRLEATGKARGIDFRGEGAANVRYVLKGYFSIEPAAKGNTIYYVWDVLDTAGARLHRLSGQEVTAGAADGKWTSVPAPTMQAVADKTIGELATWLASRAG